MKLWKLLVNYQYAQIIVMAETEEQAREKALDKMATDEWWFSLNIIDVEPIEGDVFLDLE